jgi:hypothetical protein
MARAKKQGCDLDPLQEQILLHLAMKGPRNMNQTAKEILAHYKPVRTAFHSLEEKEMIARADVVSYGGRAYGVFWLTERGIIRALLNGADSTLVQKVIKEKLPKHEETFLFAKVVSRLPKRVLEIVSSLYPSVSSEIGIWEVLKLVFMVDLSMDDLRMLYGILKESPFKEKADEAIRKASAKFEELRKTIGVRP